MKNASKWEKPANKATVERTIAALKANNIDAYFVDTGEEARKKLLQLIPKGAEVMDMTSVTLERIGIADEIQKSGNYNSVRNKLYSVDRKTQGMDMKKLGASPEWAVGSVHAVTEDGHVLIASNTGSQLPAYAYDADHVIWVAGTHKIVKNIDVGMKRIYEHSLPLESERARKAYGVEGSAVNKILIINNEVQPGRIILIFVNETLGF